ncbi:MAG TPA: hypothetical protein DCZ71_03965 [Ruminococcus sp.]|nr:hypothetical protein [Ruminococcus sp.]
MENTSDFYKNRSMLKKCEKVHNTVSKVYCVLCALIMLASFLMIVMSISSGEVLKFAGIFLSAGAVWYLGVVGVYKKIDIFSLAAPALALISLLLAKSVNASFIMGAVSELLFIASVICAVISLPANMKYRWLEQQYGFPYFNERQTEHELDMIQSDIKDRYAIEVEEIRKRNQGAGDMEEISAPDTIAVRPQETDRSGYMDEI